MTGSTEGRGSRLKIKARIHYIDIRDHFFNILIITKQTYWLSDSNSLPFVKMRFRISGCSEKSDVLIFLAKSILTALVVYSHDSFGFCTYALTWTTKSYKLLPITFFNSNSWLHWRLRYLQPTTCLILRDTYIRHFDSLVVLSLLDKRRLKLFGEGQRQTQSLAFARLFQYKIPLPSQQNWPQQIYDWRRFGESDGIETTRWGISNTYNVASRPDYY